MKTEKVKVPCHRCHGTKVTYSDSGYNTFNPGSAVCTSCGFKVAVPDCNNLDPWPEIRKAWDMVNKTNTEPCSLAVILDKIKKAHEVEAAKLVLNSDGSGEVLIKEGTCVWRNLGSFKDRSEMNKFFWESAKASV